MFLGMVGGGQGEKGFCLPISLALPSLACISPMQGPGDSGSKALAMGLRAEGDGPRDTTLTLGKGTLSINL